MARTFLQAMLALAAITASQPGVAAPGDLLWSDRFDRSRNDDRFQGIALAGKRVFAVGRSEPTDSDDADGVVRCYDAASGAPCWEDLFDHAGGEDEATAVAASGHRVFVAGTVESASGDLDFLVRAYDARSGRVLWQDAFDPIGARDRAEAVAVRGRTVFVAGKIETTHLEMLVVRAYDVRTGALLWENLFDPPQDFVNFGALAVAGRWVVLAGSGESLIAEDDFLVHVIDRRSGATRWDDLVDGAHRDNDRAQGLAVGGGRAFAVGRLDNWVSADAGSDDLVVRAYDLAKGTLLWQDVFDEMRGYEAASAAALTDGRLVVVGGGGEAFATTDFLVRCYDARRGTLLWEDTVDVAGGLDQATAVGSDAGTVVVAGRASDAAGWQQTLVRVYDTGSGALVFEDRFDAVQIGDTPVAVSAAGKRGFVVSAVVDLSQAVPGAIADAVIRTYALH